MSVVAKRHGIRRADDLHMAQAFWFMKEVAAKPVSVRPVLVLLRELIDLIDREIEPVVVPFGVAGEFAAAVSQHAQELDADIAELFDELQQSNFCTNDLLLCRHSHTKTKSPQTNGICERFHQTAFNEFYRVAFRSFIAA